MHLEAGGMVIVTEDVAVEANLTVDEVDLVVDEVAVAVPPASTLALVVALDHSGVGLFVI
jgi:hypothetical protein